MSQKDNKKNLRNFKEFDPKKYINTKPKLNEEIKKDLIVLSFGRFNPVTIGHEKLVNVTAAEGLKRKGDVAVFLSHTQDAKKNPLSYEQKLDFAKRSFGRIIRESKAKTIIEVLKTLDSQYRNVVVVVGSDRVQEFDTLLNKYNNKDYAFENIEVVSAGERDPDADGVEGMSASKIRALALQGKFDDFKKGLPRKLQRDADEVYHAVRKGMGIKELLSGVHSRKELHQKLRYSESSENTMKESKKFGYSKFVSNYQKITGKTPEQRVKELDDFQKKLAQQRAEFEARHAKKEVAEGLKQTLRKFVPGYAKREIDKKMDAGKFGKTDVDKDANFYRYKKIQDKIKEEVELEEALKKQGVAETSDYFRRRDREEAIISGKKPARKKQPAQTSDYARRRDREEAIISGKKPARKIKEEIELEEAVTVKKHDYSWGKMITVHHGSDTSYPLHPEHQEKIKKLGDGEKTTFKDETKRTVTAHRSGDTIHLSGSGSSTKTPVSRSHFTEEVELDEVSSSTMTNYIVKASKDKSKDRKPGIDRAYHKMYINAIKRDYADSAKRNLATESTEQDDELSERAVLNPQQRRAAAMRMRRIKSRIKMGRERSERKFATIAIIRKRARRRAIQRLKDKISMGRNYDDLSYAQKMAIDQRLARIPTSRIDLLARKLIPAVKQSEKQRFLSKITAATSATAGQKKETYAVNEALNRQDKDISHLPGTQPKGYYKGVPKDKKDDRARHFAKHGKMDHEDPNAYKDAPGDEDVKTKTSKYTKRFKDMFGESLDEASHRDTHLKKRPHMALEKSGAVKFDNRFKIFRKKVPLHEQTATDLIQEIFDLRDSVEELYEKEMITGLKAKAEKTGIAYGILKQVYDRGLAAWRGGHRPGATPHQWAYARVNSFVTGGKTQKTADADLWDKVKK